MSKKIRVKNLEIAWREFEVPLFFITKQVYTRGDYLVLYRDNITECYFINNGLESMARDGYRLFANKAKRNNFKRECEELIRRLGQVPKNIKKLRLSEFDDEQLKKEFVKYFDFLLDFLHIYFKTEPGRFLKIEDKINEFLKKKGYRNSDLFLKLVSLENKNYKKILCDLKAPKKIVDFTEVIREFSKIRLELRKAGEPLWHLILGIFAQKMAKQFNINAVNIRYLTYPELLGFFEGRKIKQKTLKERRKEHGFIRIKGKGRLLNKNELKEFFSLIEKEEGKFREKEVLTGRAAMKGKAAGRVRKIIHDKKNLSREIREFRKGEILVTEMTRPQIITICKKAGAIITDEGGITCHAAIVSRELKIPCIINTKIATKVLETGDLVEVDADKGIVRRIKEKK